MKTPITIILICVCFSMSWGQKMSQSDSLAILKFYPKHFSCSDIAYTVPDPNIINTILSLWAGYEEDCKRDSTFEVKISTWRESPLIKGFTAIRDTIWTHSDWTHSEPTFPGFIEWLKGKER